MSAYYRDYRYVLLGVMVALTVLKAKATHTRRVLRVLVSSHVLLLAAVSLVIRTYIYM